MRNLSWQKYKSDVNTCIVKPEKDLEARKRRQTGFVVNVHNSCLLSKICQR